jgi:hypothetical protein
MRPAQKSARFTSPRVPRVQPEHPKPSSAVLAAANPDAVAELHSTTRLGRPAAVAIASDSVDAPQDPTQPATSTTCSPGGGHHTRRCAVSGPTPARMGDSPRNSPACTARQARLSSSTVTAGTSASPVLTTDHNLCYGP